MKVRTGGRKSTGRRGFMELAPKAFVAQDKYGRHSWEHFKQMTVMGSDVATSAKDKNGEP